MSDLGKDQPCPVCGRYNNRGVSIDAIIVRDTNILLVKRGAEPFKGYWATPGGYIEWDESAEETVAREVMEETGLTVESVELIGVYSKPERHPKQCIALAYIANVKDGEPVAGDDADDVAWFSLDTIPQDLAFDHKQIITDAKQQLSKNANH